MQWTDFASGGGIVGLVAVGYYLIKLAVDARHAKRSAAQLERSADTSDTATVNAMLTRSLEALQAENTRLVARVNALEEENAMKDEKIDSLEERVRALADEIADFKRAHHARGK